jgi:hypothetical protein
MVEALNRSRLGRSFLEAGDSVGQLNADARRQVLDAFLISHPLSSAVFEFPHVPIRFQDAPAQVMWERFNSIAAQVDSWRDASIYQKLLAFALTMQDQSWQADYHQQRDWLTQIEEAVIRLEADDDLPGNVKPKHRSGKRKARKSAKRGAA